MISWLLSKLGVAQRNGEALPDFATEFHGCVRVESKSWGICKTLHESERAALHELTIEAGGESSIHWHRSKRQLFHVVSGKVLLREFDEFGETLKREQLLIDGDSWMTAPGTRHQFCAVTYARCIEVYVPRDLDSRVEADDIIRIRPVGHG